MKKAKRHDEKNPAEVLDCVSQSLSITQRAQRTFLEYMVDLTHLQIKNTYVRTFIGALES
jgi:hypothetical protein